MCLNPRNITYFNNHHMKDHFWRDSQLYLNESVPVKCGKCIECLKQKRQAVAVNAYRTAVRLPNMVFATFTYSDDSLPMSYVFEYNGDFNIGAEYDFVPEFEADDLRQMWLSAKHPRKFINNKWCTVCERSVFKVAEFGGVPLNLHITPSLSRYDWRMSIKRSRVRYLREFGKSLDFKYMCVGEYGPRTNRPHFHVLFWNLSYSDATYLFKDWQEQYGFVEYHTVEPRKHKLPNGKEVTDDGKFSCANYVSKYLVKGDSHEYKEALDGFCEKPRKLISKDVGFVNDIEPDLRRHLYAFDVQGEYDPDRFFELPKEKQDSILFVMSQRQFYKIGNRPYSLPLNLKRKLFYDVEKQPDGTIRYRPKQVQVAFTNFVRTRNDEIFANFIRCNLHESNSEDLVSVLGSLSVRFDASRHSGLEAYEQSYVQSLQRSIF